MPVFLPFFVRDGCERVVCKCEVLTFFIKFELNLSLITILMNESASVESVDDALGPVMARRGIIYSSYETIFLSQSDLEVKFSAPPKMSKYQLLNKKSILLLLKMN
jgi:hypothetical protein